MIPVRSTDEHARDVVGWLLPIPDEMGGGWLVRSPWDTEAALMLSTTGIAAHAGLRQWRAAVKTYRRPQLYGVARWWAAAYRAALDAS